MICFPLDNTEYRAAALGAWCGTRTRGVFAADGHYSVIANGDMTVTVSPGIAWLKADTYWGTVAHEINPQVLTIETADGSLARIDAICVRLDKNLNVGELVVKKGAYTPQPPAVAAPVRNLDYDEIYVATIRVRAGATSVLSTDITDQRLNENYCGLMRDGVTGIPTAQIHAQAEALFGLIRDELAGINDGTEFMLRTDYDLGGVVKSAGGIVGYTNIESGSNADGTYIKYPDGTLICTKRVETPNYVMSTAAGTGIYRGDWVNYGDFAASFVDTPVIQRTMYSASSFTCWQMNLPLACALAREGMSSGLFTAVLDVTAIGRWK